VRIVNARPNIGESRVQSAESACRECGASDRRWLNIVAIKVEAAHGEGSPQTGFLPLDVMFASNFERKHL
jgi:hypothetical protein